MVLLLQGIEKAPEGAQGVVLNYAVARVTEPLTGQETDRVARSPTDDANGW